jgi:nucleotide-binding universal stress UspA family protein
MPKSTSRRPALLANVLAATDFSRGASAAVQRMASLPLAPGATLHLIHAVPADIPRKVSAQIVAFARDELAKAASQVATAAKRAGHTDLEIVPALVRGSAYVEVIRQARAREAELIVIGRHGRRPVRDLVLGSTAERVIRMAGIPVLVVNDEPVGPYERPLVALELTDTAREMIALTRRLVESPSRCWLVHAYHVPFEPRMTRSLSAARLAEYRREFRDEAAKSFDELVEKLGDTGMQLTKVLRSGGAEAVIAREAARLRADLVCVGTHARSGVSHVLLGSVAAWVLRNVRCDVVVSRPRRFTFEVP